MIYFFCLEKFISEKRLSIAEKGNQIFAHLHSIFHDNILIFKEILKLFQHNQT